MRGLGFLCWHISDILPIESTISTLKKINAQWVSLKILDGIIPFNYVDETGKKVGNSIFLESIIAAFRNAGIEVGGWGFVYTKLVEQQAQAAVQQVKQFGLSHWLIDAEDVSVIGAQWKTGSNLPQLAQSYMNNLKLGAGFPTGLCSYRFPSSHSPFPFSTFIKHPQSTLIAPQVYWMFATNPGAQLEKSLAEHNKIRQLPFVPIGASFTEHGWSPTPEQIKEFVYTAQVKLKLPAWGFWDLEEAIKRPDWLQAMSGVDDVLPDEPPVTEPEVVDVKIEKVAVNALNVRSSIIPSARFGRVPGKVYEPSRVWFTISRGQPVEVLETIQDGKNTWYRIGLRQYVAKEFDGNIFLA